MERDVCYWGTMSFLPHLLRLLRLRGISAEVSFSDAVVHAEDRKVAARQCEAAVRELAGQKQAGSFHLPEHLLDRPVDGGRAVNDEMSVLL